MKTCFSACLLIMLMMAGALPTFAASANFQGNCNLSPANCVFDATRTPSGGTATSCAPSTISQLFWDYGDGANSGFTTSTFVAHTYSGGFCDFVDVAVFCNNGASATKSHCLCWVGINGCIRPGAGWTP